MAAICTYPNFAMTVSGALEVSGVDVAVVAGSFPSSQTFVEVKTAETALAVADGASTAKAREHATRIFEEIAAMGVSPNNINLGAKTDNRTTGAEVWIFVR